ncbi:MAG: mechanosensitive ion channel family protein [Firmicutes bacterium]|nr:mechanosensitive ion channel family protein [Bacillota bacterium]
MEWDQLKALFERAIMQNEGHIFAGLGKIGQTVLIILLSAIAIKFGSLAIQKFFDKQREFKYKLDDKRTDTLSTLCISILRYAVYFIAIVTTLQSVFGIETTTIITAAGVGGLAVGFGAQSLVKDVITGFFILLEDQFAVGDMITIDKMMGTVEEVGLRITKLRHYAGDLYIIPNGEITKVTNHTRGSKGAIVDVSVAYEEKIDDVISVLTQVSETASKEIASIVKGPEVLGVMDLGDSGVVIRIFAKTVAGQQWSVERELRKRIKDTFDREEIEIPYNKIVVINDKR